MCDMVASGAEDLRAKFYEVMYAPVELLDERKDRFLNETMPRWYQHFENLLLNNGAMYGGGKFFVGRSVRIRIDASIARGLTNECVVVAPQLSYADVLVYDTIDISSRLNPSLLNEYPLVRLLLCCCCCGWFVPLIAYAHGRSFEHSRAALKPALLFASTNERDDPLRSVAAIRTSTSLPNTHTYSHNCSDIFVRTLYSMNDRTLHSFSIAATRRVTRAAVGTAARSRPSARRPKCAGC